MPTGDYAQLTSKVPRPSPTQAGVTVRRNGTILFNAGAVANFSLCQEPKVASMYREPAEWPAIHQVRE